MARIPNLLRRLNDRITESRARKEEEKRLKEAQVRALELRKQDMRQAYETVLKRAEAGDITLLVGEEKVRDISERPDIEHQILLLDGITFHEPRVVRRGQYSGVRVRVVSGVNLYTGGWQSEGHSELREIDRGRLMITNKRVRFDGSMMAKDIGLFEIEMLTHYQDAFSVAKRGRERIMYFAGIDNTRMPVTIGNTVSEIPLTGNLVISTIIALQGMMSES